MVLVLVSYNNPALANNNLKANMQKNTKKSQPSVVKLPCTFATDPKKKQSKKKHEQSR